MSGLRGNHSLILCSEAFSNSSLGNSLEQISGSHVITCTVRIEAKMDSAPASNLPCGGNFNEVMT